MEVIGKGGGEWDYLCRFLSYKHAVVSYALSRHRYGLEEYSTPRLR